MAFKGKAKKSCGDCGCSEGELHKYYFINTENEWCDMEICPLCKGQLLSCNCSQFKITDTIREPYFEKIFCHEFQEINCERCHKPFPKTKIVPDEKWKFICGITYDKRCYLCPRCMNFISNKRKKLKKREDDMGNKK